MDLLIKGLGLPAKDDEPIYIEINPNGKIYQKGKCLHYWGELPNKAIELPPHERLIEAGKVASVYIPQMRRKCEENGHDFDDIRIAMAIADAPTIVEAST